MPKQIEPPVATRANPKHTFKGRERWPNCAVCKFMYGRPKFRDDMMRSTYFDPINGQHTLKDVWVKWKPDFELANFYQHAKRHQPKDLIRAEASLEAVAGSLVDKYMGDGDAHEATLDEFIDKGRQMLKTGKLSITSQTLLQAIKTKADIKKSDKDRKMDALRLMAGASGIKTEEKEGGSTQTAGQSES